MISRWMQICIVDFDDPELIVSLNKFILFLRTKKSEHHQKKHSDDVTTNSAKISAARTSPSHTPLISNEELEGAWAVIVVKAWRAAVRQYAVLTFRPKFWPVKKH